MLNSKTKSKRNDDKSAKELVPEHIGIIIDGNRRWAKRRGLPSSAGHVEGVENLKRIIDKAQEMGVKNLTIYVFSTENWKRTKKEVAYLFKLIYKFAVQEKVQIVKNNIQFRTIGDIKKLPFKVRSALSELMRVSRRNNKFILSLAIDYGGRSEIVRAVRKLVKKGLRAAEITERQIALNLDTAGLRDPDLIIRTGGEQRLSNFLLWQSSYSELYFTRKFWPEFKEKDFENAIKDYQRRQRRFGK